MASATLLASAALAGANLVSDGDFNSPAVSGTYATYNSGQSFGAGSVWTVGSGSVDQIGTYWQTTPDGGDSIDLDGTSPGSLSQDVGKLAAGSYELTFYLSGNPDGGPTTKQASITLGGTPQTVSYTLTGANSDSNMLWTPEKLFFTTTGGDTSLAFTSLDSGNTPYGAAIGEISLVAVPEPATWTMLMLGVGALGAGLRRSRRQSPSLAAI